MNPPRSKLRGINSLLSFPRKRESRFSSERRRRVWIPAQGWDDKRKAQQSCGELTRRKIKKTPMCHPERSEGSQTQFVHSLEILRLRSEWQRGYFWVTSYCYGVDIVYMLTLLRWNESKLSFHLQHDKYKKSHQMGLYFFSNIKEIYLRRSDKMKVNFHFAPR